MNIKLEPVQIPKLLSNETHYHMSNTANQHPPASTSFNQAQYTNFNHHQHPHMHTQFNPHTPSYHHQHQHQLQLMQQQQQLSFRSQYQTYVKPVLNPHLDNDTSGDDYYEECAEPADNKDTTEDMTEEVDQDNDIEDEYSYPANSLSCTNLSTSLNTQTSPGQDSKLTINKIRKRSANQAYEYLTSLADSKTFQDWLSNNETDFTWVHKRNSMTNAGKKYYYICNYRIKKGYLRCPAVIYALFPNNNDATVMVYSCGDHEHRRLNGAAVIPEANPSQQLATNRRNFSPNSSKQQVKILPPQIQLIPDVPEIQQQKQRNMNQTIGNIIKSLSSNGSSSSSSSSSSSTPPLADVEKTADQNDENNLIINDNSSCCNEDCADIGCCEEIKKSQVQTPVVAEKSQNIENSSNEQKHSISKSLVISDPNPLRQLNLNKQLQSNVTTNYLLAQAIAAQHNLNMSQMSGNKQPVINHKKRPLAALNDDCGVQDNNGYNIGHSLTPQQHALLSHLSSNRFGNTNGYLSNSTNIPLILPQGLSNSSSAITNTVNSTAQANSHMSYIP